MISTHVLDTARGCPAADVRVELYRDDELVASELTDADGRVRELAEGELESGDYRLRFATRRYFERSGLNVFYPEVSVIFTIEDSSHLHVPLLLSPYGYTTYKGV